MLTDMLTATGLQPQYNSHLTMQKKWLKEHASATLVKNSYVESAA